MCANGSIAAVKAAWSGSAMLWLLPSQPRTFAAGVDSGLSGVELGSFLIKRVVGELKAEFPGIETFCTLSPIPRFRRWLQMNAAGVEAMLPQELADSTRQLLVDTSAHAASKESAPLGQLLLDATMSTQWMSDPVLTKALQAPLMTLCARYLVAVRREGLAFDPVANFHLRNGACIYRINWLANTTERGNHESCAMMVNYNYLQEYVESNNQAYLFNGRIAVHGANPLLARVVADAQLGEESVFIV
ncbi:malonyl-CoA decarboxylase-domain-containing protein [Syncephalis pseudoplumigaleata]|uniref:Malonyl-CoA decarboxylase-domain-containing protein n=1 Tax=Syncephalis pseudoplumigaleata TaxID=1712513 RepID=A0A4P9YT90_9FUNG|nr:malonyl-CoA decarboxylase-domain-containing protein [Syncephalis pseudoplumigaleata]|eukprot:RKP22351.1 malonyl-CoA decarboxylase-domain-containing protein [Syncephalis pseudoplumigaleata]